MKQTATPTTTPAQQHGAPAFFGRSAQAGLSAEQAEATFFGPAPFIQAKLTIGAPDDPYEREADAVAEQVVQRMSAPASEMEEKEQIQPKIQRLPLTVQRKCAACEEEEKVQKKEEEKPEDLQGGIQRKPIFESNGDEEPPPGVQPAAPMVQRKCAACEQEEQGAVQRKPSGGGEMTASADVASRISHSKGGGSPLPESVQSAMGGALGADLSGVRVHTDSRVVQLNRDLGAQAFTHGSDVYFGAGKFKPGTGEGDRLLAHELVHVGQQGGGILKKSPIRMNRRRRSTAHGPRSSAQPVTSMRFDGSGLTLHGGGTAMFAAVSGLRSNNPRNTDHRDHTGPDSQTIPDVGPIPEGSYSVDPGDVERTGFNTGTWGPLRVRISESFLTWLSRSLWTDRTGGFFLHQDVRRDGTAGCIGLQRRADTTTVFARISATTNEIPLEVSYP